MNEHCHFIEQLDLAAQPIELLDDIVRPLWHEEVVVTAKLGKRKRIKLVDIEAADTNDE